MRRPLVCVSESAETHSQLPARTCRAVRSYRDPDVVMTTTALRPAEPVEAPRPAAAPVVDVVIPVYNEEADLERCVRRLHAYLTGSFPFSSRITIADNGSDDGTQLVALRLARDIDGVHVVRLAQKGRGHAVRTAWEASDSPVLVYMDVDLSTDLAGLLPLVAPLVSGHSDVAIGTRLARGARVVRGLRRELISRSYNLLLHRVLGARFSDAQCGFKAVRRDVAGCLLPLVRDNAWFFDTEMLVLAERAGMRIHEVPVDWVDDLDSRVDIVRTARADLHGIARLGWSLLRGSVPLDSVRPALQRAPLSVASGTGLVGQLARFALVGAVSTVVYLALYVILRGALPAQAANLVALLATGMANTAANRRFTFGVRGSRNAARHRLEGLFVFGLGLALTTTTLGLLARADGDASIGAEVNALVVANLAGTVLRFVLLRGWVFHPRRNRAGAEVAASVS